MSGILVMCLAYVFSQFSRAFLAVLTPVLAQDLGMTAADFAYASGAWFIAFAIFQFPVGILLDSINYDAAKLATLTSVFIALGTLGNIGSSEPLAAAVQYWGWRHSALAIGVVVLLIGAGIFAFLKDPEKVSLDKSHDGGYLELIKIRELWPIFPIILGGYMVAAGLRGSWIGPFHEDLFNYDTLEIGRVTLYMSIALAVGTLFYGPLDRLLIRVNGS